MLNDQNQTNHATKIKIKKKKEARDNKRKEHRPLTNKEARQKAKELGWEEDENPPKKVKEKVYWHGNPPVFKDPKKKRWISPDKDGHNGGVWKEFDRDQRIGTLDENLEPIGK